MAGAPQEVDGMASSLGTRMADCALVALVMFAGMSGANAETGRIVFSGAVVEPTCSVDDARIGAMALPQPGHGLVPARFACGTSNAAAGAARSYSLAVVSLDATTIAHNRLLDYFASYANARGVAQPNAKLVIQTFD